MGGNRKHHGELQRRPALMPALFDQSDQCQGTVFLPIHWNDQYAGRARIGAVVNPEVCPVSGEPEFKHTPVRATPLAVTWYGFAFARSKLPVTALDYWALIPGEGFQRYELAGTTPVADWPAHARELLGAGGSAADWLEYADQRAGRYRAAWIEGERIRACLFIAPLSVLPNRHWLARLFAKTQLDETDRIALLTGHPSSADTRQSNRIADLRDAGIRETSP